VRVMARVRDLRGGRENDARFHERMKGQGVWGRLLAQRFAKATWRLGLRTERRSLDLSQFRRPLPPARPSAQPSLF
jgi:hypothetical protein